MRTALLAATVLMGLATDACAAVFALVNPVYDLPEDSRARVSLQITISEAAVARGSFSYSVPLNNFNSNFLPTGDVADFINFNAQSESLSSTSTGFRPGLTANLSFAPDRSVTAASIRVLGIGDDLIFSGTGASFGGIFGGDSTQGCGINRPTQCRAVGQLVEVPEPASLALFTAGLLGLAWRRRA